MCRVSIQHRNFTERIGRIFLTETICKSSTQCLIVSRELKSPVSVRASEFLPSLGSNQTKQVHENEKPTATLRFVTSDGRRGVIRHTASAGPANQRRSGFAQLDRGDQ